MDKKHLSILKHITVFPSKPMTLARISGRLEKDTGEKIEPHILSKILKEDLNLSYKRGSSGPTQAFSSANNEMKVYTSYLLFINTIKDKYLINIDEWSFN